MRWQLAQLLCSIRHEQLSLFPSQQLSKLNTSFQRSDWTLEYGAQYPLGAWGQVGMQLFQLLDSQSDHFGEKTTLHSLLSTLNTYSKMVHIVH